MLTEHDDSADAGASSSRAPFPVLLGCLVAWLGLQAIVLVAVAVWAAVEASWARASEAPGDIALVVILALAAVWLAAMAVGTARRRPWIRASSITWHLVVFAVAVGCFTGVTAVPSTGWWLLAVALIGIGLVVSPPVTRATRRVVIRDEDS